MSGRRHVMGGVEEIGDPNAPYGSRLWCISMLRETVREKHDATTKTSNFRFNLLSLKGNDHWKALSDADGKLFGTWEDFCQYREPFGLGLSMRQVEAVLAETDDKVTAATVLARVGRPRKGEEKGSEHNLNPLGRGSAYNLARLRRDRPDLAARVDAGELSANKAAIEAGFRKPRSGSDALWAAYLRLTEEERARFDAVHEAYQATKREAGARCASAPAFVTPIPRTQDCQNDKC